MKRFILLAISIFSLSFMTAQTPVTGEDTSLDPKQVPPAVTQNFTTQYPGVTPAWHKDGDHYRVNYIDPQSKLGHVIVYDQEGTVMRKENEVDATGYPSAIGTYYSDNYPGETYQVWSTDEKTGERTLYFTNRNDETIWFDQQGNSVPAKKAKSTIKKDTKKK